MTAIGARPLIFRLVVPFLVAGCASTKKPPTPRPASQPCDGQAVLVIDNGSGYDLDVLEARSGGGVGNVIGTVGSGYHELVVRSEGGYYYFTRRAGTRTAAATQSSSRASAGELVRMYRECRSS